MAQIIGERETHVAKLESCISVIGKLRVLKQVLSKLEQIKEEWVTCEDPILGHSLKYLRQKLPQQGEFQDILELKIVKEKVRSLEGIIFEKYSEQQTECIQNFRKAINDFVHKGETGKYVLEQIQDFTGAQIKQYPNESL